MSCPKRLSELITLNLGPLNESEPGWEIGPSEHGGRAVFAARDLKRGDVIFRENPLLIGPAAHDEDSLNMCSICFKILNETKFMCRQGCGLSVCGTCAKKKQHKDECQLFKSWEPNEPHIANSQVLRLLTVARALLLTQEQQDLIYSLQASLDNNHREEVRYAAKCFRKFPTDKKLIDIINRSVAAVKTYGFNAASSEKTTDNDECPHRSLFPLFGVLNNDCVSNTTFSVDPKTNQMTVKAALDIAKGVELTTTYTKLFSNNIKRYQFLKTKKHIVCKCPRCTDPTEKGSFISGLYCRNTQCPGIVVPETKNMPHPDWNCLKCKQKSNHSQMSKSQDFASGALSAKFNADSLSVVIEYINEKSSSFIPDSNHTVIDAKLQIIEKLSESKDKYTEEEYKNKERYCTDLLGILDKLGVGDCPMRTYLETQKVK